MPSSAYALVDTQWHVLLSPSSPFTVQGIKRGVFGAVPDFVGAGAFFYRHWNVYPRGFLRPSRFIRLAAGGSIS